MLTVFNVGQGDGLLLEPGCDCKFDNPDEGGLLIDTGPAGAHIARRLRRPRVAVLLTHSHRDHIGGVPELIKKAIVGRLFVPWYLPEVTSIFRYVGSPRSLRIGQPNWAKLLQCNLALVGEGSRLCPKHCTVLNPPRNPCSYDMGFPQSPEPENDIEDALAVLVERGMDLPTEEILSYQTPIRGESVDGLDDEYGADARIFVHRFFINLSERARHAPPDSLPYYVVAHLTLTANQTSVVFVYDHPVSGRWLFTGDADETTFERLVRAKVDISAKYLKVPHHGSRNNMSPQTLQSVRPKVAIVSHGNKPFGHSRDPHPHHEVIEMLDRQKVRSYYTNPVVKGGKTIKPIAEGAKEGGLIVFERGDFDDATGYS